MRYRNNENIMCGEINMQKGFYVNFKFNNKLKAAVNWQF